MTLSDECAPAIFEIQGTGTIVFANAPSSPVRLFVCGGSFAADGGGTMTVNWLGWSIDAAANRDVLIPTGLVPVGQALTLSWKSKGHVKGWILVRLAQ